MKGAANVKNGLDFKEDLIGLKKHSKYEDFEDAKDKDVKEEGVKDEDVKDEDVKDNTTQDTTKEINAEEVIQSFGYPSESHQVTTEDGHILTIHRIPYGKGQPKIKGRPPILLQHGMLCNSATWIITGPNHGLGYFLADYGFDVWMGNFRGNKYSKTHQTLTTKDPKFWDYSFHEHGVYDLPAMIDHILLTTDQEQLFYLGHSMGATSFFVMCSERPEYNEKIVCSINVCPTVYLSNSGGIGLMVNVYCFIYLIRAFAKIIGWNEAFRHTHYTSKFGQMFCKKGDILNRVAEYLVYFTFGFSSGQFDNSFVPTFFQHFPDATSMKCFEHWCQTYSSDNFRKFDYHQKNVDYYQSKEPPKYNLGKVTAPVHLLYSSGDILTAEEDLNRLYKELGNSRNPVNIVDPKFNHYDFVFGKDARKFIYAQIAELAQSYLS